MYTRFFYALMILSMLGITACKDDDPITPGVEYDAQLENVANDVILKTYEELYHQTESLATSLSQLQADPTQQNLDIARQAWRNARTPWEQSEGFLFGPVDQQGIDPAIDSWPVNETDLDAVLNSAQVLTKSYIDGLDGTLKGFHTIEYLIFGLNGNKVVADFTTRQFEYLSACSESLVGATEQLYHSWKPSEENFIENILRAGEAGESIYPSQKAALQEIVTGLIVIADEVANGKIFTPLSQQDVTLEESRFSANSKQDFADNIRSIENVYLGKYLTADGPGISDIIATKDNTVDAQVKTLITESIAAIEAIDGTFTSAIFNSPQSIQAAQTKVRDLQQLLESDVLNIITSL